MTYAIAEPDVKYRLASTAESKTEVVDRAGRQASRHAHAGDRAVRRPARRAGRTARRPVDQGRDDRPAEGATVRGVPGREIDLLVVSKVANFSIDLPERAGGHPGLGRVRVPPGGGPASRAHLRPKSDGKTARFYAVVARDTVDADFAAHRQRFLAKQGYGYRSWTPPTLSRPRPALPGRTSSPRSRSAASMRRRSSRRPLSLPSTRNGSAWSGAARSDAPARG